MRNITILGATGSIGRSTLDIIERHPDRYQVFALTANHNVPLLLQQAQQFQPQHIVIADPAAAKTHAELIQATKLMCQIHVGAQALVDVAQATEVDIVMAGIVGAVGLMPTLAATRAGKRVLLANKEALVMTGRLLLDTALASGAELLPVDSEHNAIFQCLTDYRLGKPLSEYGVKKLILTGSGGPFRQRPLDTLDSVTPEEACKHPNWVMGRKITVDSATMMNKGLEVIEAKWLFTAEIDEIEVVLQPQSLIHSMVEYHDGSVLAELGLPDMRTPIANVLSYPERINSGVGSIDFRQALQLEFFPVEWERYPCLSLAYAALRAGGTASACLNAANEVAVDAFLNEKIRFTDIARVVEQTLNEASLGQAADLDTVLAVDNQARHKATQIVAELSC